MSVTLEVVLPSASRDFQSAHSEVTCHLSQNKPHNGCLAARFPEVTHEDFFRSELEYTVGFDREEIQLSLISRGKSSYLTAKGAKWKFKCLVGVAYLPVSVLWKEISTISMDKKLNQLK